jgi:hypothetical protein
MVRGMITAMIGNNIVEFAELYREDLKDGGEA